MSGCKSGYWRLESGFSSHAGSFKTVGGRWGAEGRGWGGTVIPEGRGAGGTTPPSSAGLGTVVGPAATPQDAMSLRPSYIKPTNQERGTMGECAHPPGPPRVPPTSSRRLPLTAGPLPRSRTGVPAEAWGTCMGSGSHTCGPPALREVLPDNQRSAGHQRCSHGRA